VRLEQLIILLFFMVGPAYAASKMTVSENQEQLATPPDKSQIIFLKPFGRGVNRGGSVSVFDVTDGEPGFLGLLYSQSKLAYFVEPGSYTFMVISNGGRYMLANVAVGKTYYVMVTSAFVDFNTSRGSVKLLPVRNGSEGKYQIDDYWTQKWLVKTKFVENTEASIRWAEDNRIKHVEYHDKYWKVWEKKGDIYIAKRTLAESDGI
jgi:hypothetical protein